MDINHYWLCFVYALFTLCIYLTATNKSPTDKQAWPIQVVENVPLHSICWSHQQNSTLRVVYQKMNNGQYVQRYMLTQIKNFFAFYSNKLRMRIKKLLTY